MPTDETPAVETQVVEAANTAAAQDADADDFDKERALATIKKLRQIEKDARAKLARLQELEDAEQKRAEQSLSDAQKAAKEAEQLRAKLEQAEQQLRKSRLKDAVQDAVQKLQIAFAEGALNDALALGLFADLETSDRGDIVGLNDAIKALQKAKPYLFHQASTAGPPDINAGARGKIASGITEDERKKAADRYRHTF